MSEFMFSNPRQYLVVRQKKHPALLFRDFAFTLAGEGCKRWLYLYLHDKIAVETNTLYKIPKNASPKTD